MKGLLISALLGASLLGGCGTHVPDIKEAWDSDIPEDPITHRFAVPGAAQIEYEIKKRVYCDLKESVQFVNNHPDRNGHAIRPYLLPLKWIVQVSLSLEVDESSNITPSIILNDPMPNSTSFNFGFGGTLSSTASRTDKFDPSYSIAYLMQPYSDQSVCTHPENDPFVFAKLPHSSSSPLILSDLGIHDWLVGSEVVTRLIQSETRTKTPYFPDDTFATSPKDIVTLETKFVITTSGNLNPAWKLVRISANTGSSPLFNTSRVRTHDLIITIGPNQPATSQTHFASQIGQAVSGGNQSSTGVH